MTYYSYATNNEIINKVQIDDLMKANKNEIKSIHKHYYPIDENNKVSNQSWLIVLYTCNSPNEDPYTYISKYTTAPSIYGVNAITEEDIAICRYFNSIPLKRKRTKSIDYPDYDYDVE